jgi:hypothetical protein
VSPDDGAVGLLEYAHVEVICRRLTLEIERMERLKCLNSERGLRVGMCCGKPAVKEELAPVWFITLARTIMHIKNVIAVKVHY